MNGKLRMRHPNMITIINVSIEAPLAAASSGLLRLDARCLSLAAVAVAYIMPLKGCLTTAV
jgi:hypothetical protein